MSAEDQRILKLMKRHSEALLEEYSSRLDGLKEGWDMVGIHKKLDEIQTTLDEHTNILGAHSKILSIHTKKLNSHTEQIGNILMDTTELKYDMNGVKLDMSLFLDKKVDKKHFIDLDTRVRVLEKK